MIHLHQAKASKQARSMTTSSDNMLFSPAASSIASASIELDVHWEPASIRSELRMAIAILSQRGLKLASKWAAGQLVGIGAGEESDYAGTAGASPSLGKWADELVELQDHELYSKSLLEAGEYLHAAAVLSKKGASGSVMPGPLENLSKFGIYLRAYSLYMAGERKKEEDSLELQRYVRACTTILMNVCLVQRAYESHEYSQHLLCMYILHVFLVCLLTREQRRFKAYCRKQECSESIFIPTFEGIIQRSPKLHAGLIRSLRVWVSFKRCWK
jgi:hypothetical protein